MLLKSQLFDTFNMYVIAILSIKQSMPINRLGGKSLEQIYLFTILFVHFYPPPPFPLPVAIWNDDTELRALKQLLRIQTIYLASYAYMPLSPVHVDVVVH